MPQIIEGDRLDHAVDQRPSSRMPDIGDYKGRIAYVVASLVTFAICLHLFDIRGSQLYSLTLVLAAPVSLLILPLSELAMQMLGWSEGGYAHVWSAEIVSVILNVVLVSVVMSIVGMIRKKG